MFIFTTLVVAAMAVIFGVYLVRKGVQWGTCEGERSARMPGDDWLDGGPPSRIVMTRAVSIAAPPQEVWPWIAQLGRGAGFYSIDGLDNGGKESAWHRVTWVPEPRLGDASAIGYLRHLVEGREMAWWMPEERWFGCRVRMVISIRLYPNDGGSRLLIRNSGDAAGPTSPLVHGLFALIDSVMACAQIKGVKSRAEKARGHTEKTPETGARDQYQLYEVIYASGERAGVAGKEKAALWREAALKDGIIT